METISPALLKAEEELMKFYMSHIGMSYDDLTTLEQQYLNHLQTEIQQLKNSELVKQAPLRNVTPYYNPDNY